MKTTKIQTTVLSALLATFLFTGCVNIQKMVDSGDYDEAIAFSIQKLRGKDKKKQKYVSALEVAVNKANDRDVRKINASKAKGDVRSWEDVFTIASRIRQRQEMLEPLLPVIDKEGYQAEFRFVKVDAIELEARETIADMYYNEGLHLLDLAEQGNKIAARDAYNTFNKIDRYFTNYRNREALMAQAHELGITRMIFRMENNAPVVLPKRFQDEVMSFGTRELNSFWNKFYLNNETGEVMDYEVVMKIQNVIVSPERIKEVQYIDRQEVKDGYEYVFDQNGNVLKDTLGNDIKKERFVWVEARVFETFQQKEVQVEARLEYIDLHSKSLVDSDNLGVAAVFENYASTYRGDPRALSNRTRGYIGNHPLPFPATENMLLQAAEELKPDIRANINSKRLI